MTVRSLQPTASASARSRWHLSLRQRRALWGYLFLAPNLLGFLVFTLGPVIAALAFSLTDWDLINRARWVGLQNYVTLIGTDETFRITVKNTLIYTGLSVPLNAVLALALALAMNLKLRGITFYRAVYFLPVVSSMVAVALVWRWLYNYEFGLINQFLAIFSIPPVKWLNSSRMALISVTLMAVWKNLGRSVVIFLAGLQDIPEHLYEAARLDGANSWQQFSFVTLPMLSPTTFFVLVTSIIGSFQAFDQIFVMTKGGPGRATSVIVYYLYQNAFMFFRMGYASAIAYILFIIVFACTLVQVRWAGGWTAHE